VEQIISEKLVKEEIQQMYQFIPKEFSYLRDIKKVKHKEINLKTDYLINIISELVVKFLFTNDLKFNLWSVILRRKYGKHYNYYFDYLVQNKFIYLVSNYYVGKKCKTYKINDSLLKDIIRTSITDKILLKKYTKEYLNQNFLYFNNSPIDLKLREQLVNDLYKIKLNYDGALNLIKTLKKNREIDTAKYVKNLSSIYFSIFL
jgi:hypothetical protein